MEDYAAASMYREHILDLFKNPHNFGNLDNKTHEHFGNNPLCGDEIKIELQIEEDKVKDIKFSGKGCAISMASASLLTDKVKGMPVQETLKMTKDDILELMMIPIGPVRLKCALLCLDTLKEALNENKN